ncbi:aldo/keto reductase [Nonlabens ulvanivorans]|uniref:aldo/keto reductase n=1 Tax=Nonlabens ulvanivorans TaxID=906888 RepID=UPI002942ABF8|nr:aldo/keto reductase [Nonlabens ulvanivorans]WOI24026.1 aldo/keto reductase [Nonlabens ulvanivorans]
MSNLSKIALGTVQFGIDYGISNKLGKPDQHVVKQILDFALVNEITTLDTASAYGDSELVLGNYGVSDFKVITKFLPQEVEKGIESSFQDSLTKLKSKSVYGYLAHRADSIDVKTWSFLKHLKKIGQVEKIGYSLQSVSEFEIANEKGFFPDLIQVPFNLLDNRFKKLCKKLSKQGVEIHSRSTFLQGLFFMNTEELQGLEEAIPVISELQNTHSNQLAQYLLNYVLQQDFIDKVVIGVQSKEQLSQNISELDYNVHIKDLDIVLSEKILNPALWPKK